MRGKNGPTSLECDDRKERNESNGWTEELSLDEEMKLFIPLQGVMNQCVSVTSRTWKTGNDLNEIKATMIH